MKNFYVAVWGTTLFFLAIMAMVVSVSFARSSNSTGHDPAQIGRERELALESALEEVV